ncbi:low-density lipoprotein receptor-related protein 2 [Hydra vulgaris]|uniref:low-density lipoprotein receptor-related protein 2 n=1 Tax=Hydra vulgaris TaxID=6087 RepID=UPI0032EA18B2
MMLVKCNFLKSICVMFCLVYTTELKGQTTQITTSRRTKTVSGPTTQLPTTTRTTGSTTVNVCFNYQFQCFNDECIPLFWKCDGRYDCSDNSDEDPSICKCSSFQFYCSSGECIQWYRKCDGRYDCLDNSDEDPSKCPTTQSPTTTLTSRTTTVNGPTTQSPTTTLTSRTTTVNVCSVDSFFCSNGECIHLYWKCDGINDCSDNSDEDPSSCSETTQSPTKTIAVCTDYQFQCSNGECIPLYWKCNDRQDCSDNSDEDTFICSQTTNLPTKRRAGIGLSGATTALVLFCVLFLVFLLICFVVCFRHKKRMQRDIVQFTSETQNTTQELVPTQADPNNQMGVYNRFYVNEPPPPYEPTVPMYTPFNNLTDEPPPSYNSAHVNFS